MTAQTNEPFKRYNMKYFEVIFVPQTSKHSLKKEAVDAIFFVEAKTKKEARTIAESMLADSLPADADNYRAPQFNEITENEYNEHSGEKEPEFDPVENWGEDCVLDIPAFTLVAATVCVVGYDGNPYSKEEWVKGEQTMGKPSDDRELINQVIKATLTASYPVRNELTEDQFMQLINEACSSALGEEGTNPDLKEAVITHITDKLGMEYQIDADMVAKEEKKQPLDDSEIYDDEPAFTESDGARYELSKFNLYNPFFALVSLVQDGDGKFYSGFSIKEKLENGKDKLILGNHNRMHKPYSNKYNALFSVCCMLNGNLDSFLDKKKDKERITEATAIIKTWSASEDSLLTKFDNCTFKGHALDEDALAELVATCNPVPKHKAEVWAKDDEQPEAEDDFLDDDDDGDFDDDDFDDDDFLNGDDFGEDDEIEDAEFTEVNEPQGDLDTPELNAAAEAQENDPSFAVQCVCRECGGVNINSDEECKDCNDNAVEDEPAARMTDSEMVKEINAEIKALKIGEAIILDDIPNGVYQKTIGLSKGKLDTINRDPALIKWAENCPENPDKKTTGEIGNGYHCMVSEAHKFGSEFAVMPAFNLRTNEGKEQKAKFMDEVKERDIQILTSDQYQLVSDMTASVNAHPTMQWFFSHKDAVKAEQSIWYRVSETVVLKIRPDLSAVINGQHYIIDLKSTDDCEKFERSVEAYRYHVQDAFYSYVYGLVHGVTPVFAFCVTQKKYEFGRCPTRLMQLMLSDKAEGAARMNHNISTYIQCLESGIWGGFETVTRGYFDTRDDLTAVNERSKRQKLTDK